MKAEVFTEGEKQTNKQHGLMCSIIETRDFCLKLSKPILDDWLEGFAGRT